jgi:hypothetical protein
VSLGTRFLAPVSNNMTMNLVTIAHGGSLPLKVLPLASELKNPQ